MQSRNFGEIKRKMSKIGPILSNQISISLVLQIRWICLKLFLHTFCSKTRVIAGCFLKKISGVSVSAFDSLFLLFRLKKQDLAVSICSCFRKKCFNVNNFGKILKKSPVKFAFYALVTTFSKRQLNWQSFLDICRRSSCFAILKFQGNLFSIFVFTWQWLN